MHRDYYEQRDDATAHHTEMSWEAWHQRDSDSYLGTLCAAHQSHEAELFPNSYAVDCTQAMCMAECCVCTA